jgi:hypothetical protein
MLQFHFIGLEFVTDLTTLEFILGRVWGDGKWREILTKL